MARSSYIYLLWNKYADCVIGAYTVKHEAMTGIRKALAEGHPLSGLCLVRHADGKLNDLGAPVEVNEPAAQS